MPFVFPLTSPENERLEVRCLAVRGDRTVEHQGHEWDIRARDYACDVLRDGVDDVPLARLRLIKRDDTRRVGRLELEGLAVQIADLPLMHAPGNAAPWETLPSGYVFGYLLAVDGRTLGHVELMNSPSLRLERGLSPELRRALGLAATLLAVLYDDLHEGRS